MLRLRPQVKHLSVVEDAAFAQGRAWMSDPFRGPMLSSGIMGRCGSYSRKGISGKQQGKNWRQQRGSPLRQNSVSRKIISNWPSRSLFHWNEHDLAAAHRLLSPENVNVRSEEHTSELQ